MFSASKTKQAVSGAYTLTKSLRFRSSATAYLNRTPSTATNRRTWTWSAWVKRGKLGVIQELFDAYWANTDNGYFWIGFTNADALEIQLYNSTLRTTSAIYRDSSAWYHIVVAIDTTLATASNRVRLYVNGSEVTAFSTNTAPTQNLDTAINYNGAHYIGSFQGTSNLFDGYQTDVYLIDGQQLTPSSFGATDATTGQWSPAKYTVTYGTNGFHLTFANTTSTTTLGYDTSGNSNNFTTTNFSLTAGSTYDSMNDVPTLTSATASNYCVVNPADTSTNIVVSNGNLSVSKASAVAGICKGSICASSGKWYAEFTCTSTVNYVGIASATTSKDTTYMGQGSSNSYGYYYTGSCSNNGTSISGYGATYTTGDVIGVAMNLDTGTLTYYKNGTSQGVAFSSLSGSFTFAWGDNTGGISGNWNFGQQPWQYSPPSGYVALNTYNLPTPTIVQGNKYMDATLYTGTLIAQSITNAGSFQPDFVWIKSRSAATDNKLTDSNRGATKALISNTTGAETTDTLGLTAFNSNGFTISTDTNYNNSGATYVAWQWKAGQGSNVSNTNGSITSTVSANTTAGFSVVTFTATANSGSIGHGLGVSPSMIILKSRNNTSNWVVYHSSLGADKYILLDSSAASVTNTSTWQNTTPTSTVFYSNGPFVTGYTEVAYCFAPIAGFSAFGSYTGNGSATGPFIYTGFRPKYIMWKRSDAVSDWGIVDTSRNTYNSVGGYLAADTSGVEGTYTMLNIVSNGWQIIWSDSSTNTSGGTYIYMAFAENPTKYALAR